MLLTGALDSWKRQPHGPRIQIRAIGFISERLQLYDNFSDVLKDEIPSLTEVCRDCVAQCTPDVSVDTLRRWWNLYIEWGELPYKVKERKKILQKKYKHAKKNEVLNDADILPLKELVDKNPNYYLDELAFNFGVKTGKFVHHSTIRRCMIEKLQYSMKVLNVAAKQQCKDEETRYLQAMEMVLQSNPDWLVTIDETHKDRNAARRRRGWSHRGNTEGMEVKEWYENVIRYTLLAAADVNGFIPSACHTVQRDDISDESAAGTVDADYFLYWVKTYLCPVLGNYEYGEPRSVVLMDNASTHLGDEVERAIESTGAILIYSAPYSPCLNPIELYFGEYKKYLKKNDKRMLHQWHTVHTEALNVIDRDKGIKFFRKSRIPGSYLIATTEEYNNQLINNIH